MLRMYERCTRLSSCCWRKMKRCLRGSVIMRLLEIGKVTGNAILSQICSCSIGQKSPVF